MTDTAPTVTICDEDGCAVVIPADNEKRRIHRAGHIHNRKVMDAIRATHRDLKADNTALRGEVASLRAELHREIDAIDIPAPVAPIKILTADELEPLEDEPEDTLEETEPEEPGEELPATVPVTHTIDDYPLAIDRPNEIPYTGFGPRPTIG